MRTLLKFEDDRVCNGKDLPNEPLKDYTFVLVWFSQPNLNSRNISSF